MYVIFSYILLYMLVCSKYFWINIKGVVKYEYIINLFKFNIFGCKIYWLWCIKYVIVYELLMFGYFIVYDVLMLRY